VDGRLVVEASATSLLAATEAIEIGNVA